MTKHVFPVIEKLSDVYDAIDINCFYLVKKDNYQIINYMFSSPEAFPSINPGLQAEGQVTCLSLPDEEEIKKSIIKREFRGLIFDLDGKLVRRPFHKFFNVGERVETAIDNIDVSTPHVILEKLDGSMIAPFAVKGGRIIWGTKMGQTDVSDQVELWIGKNYGAVCCYTDFVYACLEENYTPIFEWCSNHQRIVIDYPQSSLVLTAIREMKDGHYVSYDIIKKMAEKFGIPVVKAIASDKGLTPEFLEQTKLASDCEGYVIRFIDGQMFKIKSDWYCQLHRVKAEVNYERGVVTLLLGGKMDDLKSMMPAHDLARIEKYEEAFNKMMLDQAMMLAALIRDIRAKNTTRKDFALNIMPTYEKWVANIVFKTWDKSNEIITNSCWGEIKDYILSNCGRNVKFDEMRKSNSLFGKVPEWKPLMFDSDE